MFNLTSNQRKAKQYNVLITSQAEQDEKTDHSISKGMRMQTSSYCAAGRGIHCNCLEGEQVI